MTTTSVLVPSGGFADSIWYAVQDSAGYMDSNTGTAPAAGDQDGHSMLEVVGLQDFPFAASDPQTPTQRGNKGALARFVYPSAELPSSTLTTGASGYTFEALLTAQAVGAYGGGEFIGRQGGAPTFADILLLVVGDAESLDSGNTGTMWEGRFIYYCRIYPKGRNSFNDSAVPTYDYTVVANNSSTLPFGVTHATDMGDTNFPYVDFTWPYKPILHRWTGDNSETDFNLGQNIAEDSSDNIIVYVGGTAQTWVTGVPSAGEFGVTEGATDVVVFGTAPGSSAKAVALYGWS